MSCVDVTLKKIFSNFLEGTTGPGRSFNGRGGALLCSA